MDLTSDERYKNAEVNFLKIRKADEIWVSMKNGHDGLGVKDMSDLVLKEIYGKYERKHFADNKIKKYKMTEREIFEKYDNVREHELNSKSNKEVYITNNVMTSVIVKKVKKKGQKKRKENKNKWIQKKIRVSRV